MGDIFGSIYCLFEDFFGIELANYLWGLSSPEQQDVMFIGIGMSMLVISLLVAILYYYVVDHPRLGNIWGWLIFLGVNAFVNFLVGWQWVLKDYYDGLMIKISAVTGKLEDLPIDGDNIVAFGVTNAILSVLAFCIVSSFIKWKSINVSHVPF